MKTSLQIPGETRTLTKAVIPWGNCEDQAEQDAINNKRFLFKTINVIEYN